MDLGLKDILDAFQSFVVYKAYWTFYRSSKIRNTQQLFHTMCDTRTRSALNKHHLKIQLWPETMHTTYTTLFYSSEASLERTQTLSHTSGCVYTEHIAAKGLDEQRQTHSFHIKPKKQDVCYAER